jgi:hypothetical protein
MIRPHVKALAERGSVSLAEWQAFRGNSWEMELIIPKLTDEALAHCARHMVENCRLSGVRPFRTYNEAVPGLIVPELLNRIGQPSPRADNPDALLAAYDAVMS